MWSATGRSGASLTQPRRLKKSFKKIGFCRFFVRICSISGYFKNIKKEFQASNSKGKKSKLVFSNWFLAEIEN